MVFQSILLCRRSLCRRFIPRLYENWEKDEGIRRAINFHSDVLESCVENFESLVYFLHISTDSKIRVWNIFLTKRKRCRRLREIVQDSSLDFRQYGDCRNKLDNTERTMLDSRDLKQYWLSRTGAIHRWKLEL